ncbi:MAG TPA: hypothetical protein VE863_15335 [Pyrinomonadaceae bacterium]|jgi:hypothetical protein|nr:hypothetical protein [Pyrinomonadaceae bacterium]
MSASDIVAIIGAAAWVPQIVQWVNNALRKPRVELFSAPTLIVGYTSKGPFLQLTASIASENDDVVVTGVDILARHSTGEERKLTWFSVTESQFNLRAPTGETLSMNRAQTVLAIKATTDTLAEKFIAFHDHAFVAEVQRRISIAKEHYSYLRGQTEHGADEALRSREFAQAEQFLTDNSFWREGTYRLDITISGKQLKEPHRQALQINLSRRDVDVIKKDLVAIKDDLKTEIAGGPKTNYLPSWAYPSVIPIK